MDYSSWSVPQQTLSYLESNLMILVSVMFVLGFVLIVRYSAKVIPALAGAVAYLIFGFLGTELLCMVASVIPVVNIVYQSALSYSVFRALVLALMYHVGRYISIHITSKEKYTIGNSMMAGFGNAVGYGLVSGFNYIYTSAIGTTINEMGVEAMIEGYTPEEVESVIQSITNLVNEPSLLYLVLGLGAVIDMAFMVLVCVMVYGICNGKLPLGMHGVAVLANFFIVLPSVLLECYSVDNYILMTVIKAGVLAIFFMAMMYVDRMYLNREFVTAGGVSYKTTSHLPRMKK